MKTTMSKHPEQDDQPKLTLEHLRQVRDRMREFPDHSIWKIPPDEYDEYIKTGKLFRSLINKAEGGP